MVAGHYSCNEGWKVYDDDISPVCLSKEIAEELRQTVGMYKDIV